MWPSRRPATVGLCRPLGLGIRSTPRTGPRSRGFAMTSEHPAADERGEKDPAALDVAVIGGGQAGLAIGQLLARPGSAVRDPRGGPGGRLGVAGPVGLARRCSPRARYDASPACRSPASPTATPTATRSSPTSRPTPARSRCPSVTDQPGADAARPRTAASCSSSRARRRRGRPGGGGDGAVPGAAHAGARRRARPGGRPDPQHRLPPPRRCARRARAGRRRWQHRLPDRRGARADARGRTSRRLAPDAAAAAPARARPVLVADADRAAGQDVDSRDRAPRARAATR